MQLFFKVNLFFPLRKNATLMVQDAEKKKTRFVTAGKEDVHLVHAYI